MDHKEETRLCSECGLTLPLSDFSTKPNGYVFPRCKTCVRGAVRIEKECKNCGKLFPATSLSKKIYCSLDCKRFAENRRNSEQASARLTLRKSNKDVEITKNHTENPEIFAQYRDLPTSRAEALKIQTDRYFTGLKCSNGHLSPKYTKNRLCIACLEKGRRESEARRRADGRFQAQRNRSNARNRQRRRDDEEYRLSQNSRAKEWQSVNRPHLAAYMQRQRDENPGFLVQQRLQTRLNRVLKRIGTIRSNKMDRYLGCTSEELVAHLERQFTGNMSWETKGEWHVDHIRPCASFDLTNENEIMVCFNWRNLQPMDSRENLSKQDKYSKENEMAWIKVMRDLGYEGELFQHFS